MPDLSKLFMSDANSTDSDHVSALMERGSDCSQLVRQALEAKQAKVHFSKLTVKFLSVSFLLFRWETGLTGT